MLGTAEPIDDASKRYESIGHPPSENSDSESAQSPSAVILHTLDWFHGFIPREDLLALLHRQGDFIVRTTAPKPTGPIEEVLSLRISEEDSPQSIRHVILCKKKEKDGNIVYYVDPQIKHSSIEKLINFYCQKAIPLFSNIATSVLRRGVKRKRWEFLHENILLKENLGEGEFGEVRAGETNIDGEICAVAVKILKTTNNPKDLELRKAKAAEMMHEARIMRGLVHENVLQLYGVALCKEPLMIILELVNGGTIQDVVTYRRVKCKEKTKHMSLGTARGLEYIHSQDRIHRDIAARNILYSRDRVPKISDFGMSRRGNFYKMSVGKKKIPIKWTAPETLTKYVYSTKTDVFSFGILLWEIFADGEEPYRGMDGAEVRRMLKSGERLESPQNCPPQMYDLMNKCWIHDPESRYTMKQAVEHIEKLLGKKGTVPGELSHFLSSDQLSLVERSLSVRKRKSKRHKSKRDIR